MRLKDRLVALSFPLTNSALLAPYIGAAAIVAVGAIVAAKKFKRKK